MSTLRPYQLALVESVRAAYRDGARAVLMQLGCGGGKTHTAAACIASSVALGNRVIFAAHLESLITDTSARLRAAGIDHGIVQADRPSNPGAPVQVVSLQTLHARPDCRPPADLLIVDECRRAAAPTVRAILDAYPHADLLGLDATPERSDGTPMRDIFDAMVCGPSIAWLTGNGFLVPAIVLSPGEPSEPGTLAMDPAEAIARYAEGRRVIVFTRDIQEAHALAAKLPPGTCAVVTGETTRRAREDIRARIASGDLRTLVNVNVYRDGADLPSLDCVVLARGMDVCSAYLQSVGRGLRSHPGKRDCLVLDLTGAAILHGLPADRREWSLDGEPRRTGEALVALCRCAACYAVFHAGPSQCPRCGASTRGARVKRRATRIERMELDRLDERPQAVCDAIAIAGIEKRLRSSGRFSDAQVPRIARSIFEKQRKRRAA